MALTPWPETPAALRDAVAALRQALGHEANASNPPVDDALDLELKRMGPAVAATVERYASQAPQATRDEAVVRGIAWLRDTRGAARMSGAGSINFQPAPTSSAAWFRNSGAAALLAPWRRRRAGVV